MEYIGQCESQSRGDVDHGQRRGQGKASGVAVEKPGLGVAVVVAGDGIKRRLDLVEGVGGFCHRAQVGIGGYVEGAAAAEEVAAVDGEVEVLSVERGRDGVEDFLAAGKHLGRTVVVGGVGVVVGVGEKGEADRHGTAPLRRAMKMVKGASVGKI